MPPNKIEPDPCYKKHRDANLAEFNKRVKEKSYTVLGKFKNKHGEEFVLYTMFKFPAVFITGDELDWEGSWEYKPFSRLAFQSFMLTAEEEAACRKIYNDLENYSKTGRSRK